MKKLVLMAACVLMASVASYAAVTADQIKESQNRIAAISKSKEKLQKAKTGDAKIDKAKDDAVALSEEVIKSGNRVAELYDSKQNGQPILNDLLALADQLADEGLKAADLATSIEEASKAQKSIKNPMVIKSAATIVTEGANVSTQLAKEIAFEVELVKDMVQELKK